MGDASERAARAQERLAAQRAEAKSNPEYGQTFKGPASADDKKARRKQILSTIGAWRRRGRPLAPFSGGTPARGACLTAVLSVSSLNAAGPQSAAAPVRGRGRGLAPRACGGRAQARTCWWRRLTSRSASRYVPGALTLNQIIGRLAASGAVPALHARPPLARPPADGARSASCRQWPAAAKRARGAQATFTFVVRSFTVLDGIGKTLDPRFDISEIAAPYARELLLEGSPQIAKLRSELGKRLAVQARARLGALDARRAAAASPGTSPRDQWAALGPTLSAAVPLRL